MAMTAPRGRTQRRRRRRSDPASTRALERATHQPPPHRAGLRSSRRRARRRRRRRRRARRRTTTTMPRRLKRPPTRTSSRHAAAAAAGRHLWTRCRRLRPHRRHATRTRARRAAAPKLSSPQESTRALARRGRRRPCHSTGIMSMSRPEARLPQRLGPLGGLQVEYVRVGAHRRARECSKERRGQGAGRERRPVRSHVSGHNRL